MYTCSKTTAAAKPRSTRARFGSATTNEATRAMEARVPASARMNPSAAPATASARSHRDGGRRAAPARGRENTKRAEGRVAHRKSEQCPGAESRRTQHGGEKDARRLSRPSVTPRLAEYAAIRCSRLGRRARAGEVETVIELARASRVPSGRGLAAPSTPFASQLVGRASAVRHDGDDSPSASVRRRRVARHAAPCG